MMNKKDLILEVGVEEIPSTYLEIALEDLEIQASRVFTNAKLSHELINCFATPRRIVVYVRGLADRQSVEDKKITGPSKAASFDAAGKPTQALSGFLKAQGARLADIKIETTQRGDYVTITRQTGGKTTKALLKEMLPSLIKNMHFPKSMRWHSDAQFVRPIHWILALYGNEKIQFKFGDVSSSNVTYGHRLLSPGPFKVKEPGDYFRQLKKKYVILEQDKRREIIEAQLRKLAALKKAKPVDDPELLESVIYLTEYPSAFCGSFDKNYLSLPAEVLEVSMAKNQRIFGLVDQGKNALPYFIAVTNGKPKNVNMVRRNYERVLDAKLKDSAFFYKHDMAKPLSANISKLGGLIFLKDLGTMDEKTKRLARSVKFLCEQLNLPDKAKENVIRAAELCKADLASEMVKEFPALQGIMGMVYALKAKEDKGVAEAIREHYLPRFAGDTLPKTDAGALLAIADKADLLVGAFGIGIEPTGSWDPYALRRHGTGLVRIIIEKKYLLSLEGLIEFCLSTFGEKIKLSKAKLIEELSLFLGERVKGVFSELEYKQDLTEAVMASGYDNLYGTYRRLDELAKIEKTDYFQKSAKVMERTANILKSVKEPLGGVDSSKFAEPLEAALWEKFTACKKDLMEELRHSRYANATKLYAQYLSDIIHEFFDKITVNAPDEALRANRLSMMREVNQLYSKTIADLSKIK
ncbi:MAG: glycine--tRNA ligase subunit beta [Candidatus Omnitrophota bacterium]